MLRRAGTHSSLFCAPLTRCLSVRVRHSVLYRGRHVRYRAGMGSPRRQTVMRTSDEGGTTMDAIERWREAVAEEAQMETGVGAALVGLGVVSAAFVLLRRRRGWLAWAIPGAL